VVYPTRLRERSFQLRHMEIVEMLLSAGADPSVKNDLGENAISLSIAYPELRGVIKKYTS